MALSPTLYFSVVEICFTGYERLALLALFPGSPCGYKEIAVASTTLWADMSQGHSLSACSLLGPIKPECPWQSCCILYLSGDREAQGRRREACSARHKVGDDWAGPWVSWEAWSPAGWAEVTLQQQGFHSNGPEGGSPGESSVALSSPIQSVCQNVLTHVYLCTYKRCPLGVPLQVDWLGHREASTVLDDVILCS